MGIIYWEGILPSLSLECEINQHSRKDYTKSELPNIELDKDLP